MPPLEPDTSLERAPATIKSNWSQTAACGRDGRTPDRIEAHYRLEKALAARLAQAPLSRRRELYAEVYDTLFSSLPDHPQHLRRADASQAVAERQLRLLRQLVPPGARFMEIGAGDALVSLGMAERCAEAIAVDVSEGVFRTQEVPANFRFLLIDGIQLPVPEGSVDFVYSNQLMEHLHEDDARAQLAEIFRVLAPGGSYLCITPNRLTGPHDVSKYFDDVPTGFHLKEYTYRELAAVFRDIGFTRIETVWTKGAHHMVLPDVVARTLEAVAGPLLALGQQPINNRVVRNLFGICMLGHKG